MITTPYRSRTSSPRQFLRAVVLTFAGTLLVGAVRPAMAQEDVKPKIQISYDGINFDNLTTIVGLRPNVEQTVHVRVNNAGKDKMKNWSIKLIKFLPDNTTQVLVEKPLPVIEPEQSQRVKFADKPGPALEKGKPIPWPELEVPYKFQFLLEKPAPKSDDTKTPVVVEFPPFQVKILTPDAYMKVSPPKYEVAKQRFSVSIAAKEDFFGPKADVELVLSPEVIPGLIDKRVAGAYRQVVKKPGEKVTLVADKLQFAGAPPKFGRVYVTVDGYERAFIFDNSFTEGSPVPLTRGPRARIVASHFAVPGEKYPVRIEVDDPPADGSVDLGFDRSGDEQFAVEKLPGFREQHVYFVPEGPKGGLAFNTIVHDWTRDLDTTGVLGKRQLRVQLSKAGDQEAAVDLVDELDPEELNPKARPDERLPLLTKDKGNPRAPLSYDLASKKAVLATITLDGTPPEDVDFVGWPTKLIRGKPLPLKATGHDDESDISTVTFFLGEPENGKIPPKAVQTKGVLVDAKKAVWLAELPLPTAKPGKFEVSVQFTNGAGLAAEIKTVIIELVDGPKGNPKGGTTVKGKVFQGELTPPDVGVALVDEKGNVKAAGKTNKMGQYVLEGVPPGTYRVVAVRPADGTQGQTAITVPEGKELIDGVDVQISR